MANKSAGTWAGAHSPYTQMLFTCSFKNHVEHLLCARLCSGPYEYNSKQNIAVGETEDTLKQITNQEMLTSEQSKNENKQHETERMRVQANRRARKRPFVVSGAALQPQRGRH